MLYYTVYPLLCTFAYIYIPYRNLLQMPCSTRRIQFIYTHRASASICIYISYVLTLSTVM